MSTEHTPLDAEKLLKLLSSIDRSLSHLAAVARLPHVYTDGAVKGLIDQYGKLKYAESAAFEKFEAANEQLRQDGLSYEQRVEKLGEDAAALVTAPHLQAHEERKKAMAELRKFRDENPLIVAIVDGTRCGQ
ncbi:hypothetical protein QE400_000069 [Xanthomonas sacchari]|uniref:hypothetical protein n=1 Tax=Xanthomonas sacchari TaxID=56458 RepID=UPI0027811C23|nr:hypothetical protein [Xanthomonas sacchari]MDQ1090656.1 hypothetical protein [Xanthomonas sacchari]